MSAPHRPIPPICMDPVYGQTNYARAIAEGMQMLADDGKATALAHYEASLQNIDWAFEFSDDGRKVERTRGLIRALRVMQREVDPSGEVWNRHAPPLYRVEVVA